MEEYVSSDTPTGTAPVSPFAEARGLLAAFLVTIVIFLLGILDYPRPTGWLRILHIEGFRALEVMQLYFSGPACPQVFQTAQGSVDGQYARIEFPAIGAFELQVRTSGLYTIRPLTEVREAEGCRFDPRYVGPSS
jgi:hypothetical protein